MEPICSTGGVDHGALKRVCRGWPRFDDLLASPEMISDSRNQPEAITRGLVEMLHGDSETRAAIKGVFTCAETSALAEKKMKVAVDNVWKQPDIARMMLRDGESSYRTTSDSIIVANGVLKTCCDHHRACAPLPPPGMASYHTHSHPDFLALFNNVEKMVSLDDVIVGTAPVAIITQ